MDLDEVEMNVLGLLLFPERFSKIVEESQAIATEHVVADALKNLIHKKLIVAGYMSDENVFSTSVFYDSDKMKQSAFKASRKGLDALDNQSKV